MSGVIHTSAGDKSIDPYKAKNYDEAPLAEKVEDLTSFVKNIKFAMMTTRISGSDQLTSRCMALAAQENGGIDLLFHTNLFTGKAMDLTTHPESVNISFLDQISGSWASVSGVAHIIADSDTVQKYYSPILQAWLGDLGDGVHDGGPNDPRIGMIKVEAKVASYSITAKGALGRAAETIKGAVKGEAPALYKLRELSEEELATWRSTHGQ